MKIRYCVLLLTIVLSCTNLFAYDCEVDGIYYNRTSSTEVEVTYKSTSGWFYSGDITIPESIVYANKTLKVTGIGNKAFANGSKLTSVVIPVSVTKIGEEAFMNCTSLTTVSIPDKGLTVLDHRSFSGCSNLKNFNIPLTVTTIGNSAFNECKVLEKIVIPDGVTTIGAYAFYACHALEEIVIPQGVTTIEGYTFTGCISLSSIILPEGLKKIGENAIANTAINSIRIPNTVSDIRSGAFGGNSNLTSIAFPEGLTVINGNMCRGCTSLTSIDIPNTVTKIGGNAFELCSSLTTIYIPESVTDIYGGFTFYKCPNISKIYCFGKPAALASNAFDSDVFAWADVYVPKGYIDLYKNDSSAWQLFFSYFEFDPDGIETFSTNNSKETSRYTLDGQRITTPEHGLNIVRMNDGKIKKVLVK